MIDPKCVCGHLYRDHDPINACIRCPCPTYIVTHVVDSRGRTHDHAFPEMTARLGCSGCLDRSKRTFPAGEPFAHPRLGVAALSEPSQPASAFGGPMNVDHSDRGTAWLRRNLGTPVIHEMGAPCTTCEAVQSNKPTPPPPDEGWGQITLPVDRLASARPISAWRDSPLPIRPRAFTEPVQVLAGGEEGVALRAWALGFLMGCAVTALLITLFT